MQRFALFALNYLNCLYIQKFVLIFLVQLQVQSTPEAAEVATFFNQFKFKFQQTLNALVSFQAKNSERIFNTGFPFTTLCLQHMLQLQFTDVTRIEVILHYTNTKICKKRVSCKENRVEC